MNTNLWEYKLSEVLYGISFEVFVFIGESEFYRFCDEVGDVTINEFNETFNERYTCHNITGTIVEYLSPFTAIIPTSLKGVKIA